MPEPDDVPSITIIGAGIGGLTLALDLHARIPSIRGKIDVFEASSTLSNPGVGLNILPSAAVIMRNLGLLEDLRATGFETTQLSFFNKFGSHIVSEPRGRKAGYKLPQISIRRGEFQRVLFEAAVKRLGRDRIHLGHRFVYSEQNKNQNTVTCHLRRRGAEDGDADTRSKIIKHTANILVGADGINSTVRRELYPDEGPAVFSGRILYRASTVREPYLDGAT